MNTAAIVGILVALVVVGGVVWYLAHRKRTTESLQAQNTPEAPRTVSEVESRPRAEDELVKRQERSALLELRPLPPDQRQQFAEQWRAVQATFVDDPSGAVRKADALVEEVMKARGYPVADFEERVDDLSDRQLRFVDNYLAARAIAEGQRRNDASTEDFRTAVVCYGELFDHLLEDPERATDRAVERAVEYDVSPVADDTPITDEHEHAHDEQRPDRAEPDVRL